MENKEESNDLLLALNIILLDAKTRKEHFNKNYKIDNDYTEGFYKGSIDELDYQIDSKESILNNAEKDK